MTAGAEPADAEPTGAEPTGARNRRGRAGGQIVRAAALAATAVFAGGGLVTQTVVVPYWRSLQPDEALRAFAAQGPPTGATLFPVELLSVVLLVIVVVVALRRVEPGRFAWAAALACMAATLLLLPVYFAAANAELLSQALPPDDVTDALATWYRWNWVRTGLAFAAVVFCCAGSDRGRP